MKKYYVYDHISPSGKHYIGITCQLPEKRWGKDGKRYLEKKKDGQYVHPPLALAILKYGWDNMEHQVLFHNCTEELAKKLEIAFIKYWRDKGLSYNIAKGGDTGKNAIYTPEELRERRCARCRQYHKEHPLTEEQKEAKLEASRRSREKHRDEINDKRRASRAEHREEYNAKAREYRASRKEELNAKAREKRAAYRAEHPIESKAMSEEERIVKHRESNRRYIEKHRDIINANQRERRAIAKAQRIAAQEADRLANPDKYAAIEQEKLERRKQQQREAQKRYYDTHKELCKDRMKKYNQKKEAHYEHLAPRT